MPIAITCSQCGKTYNVPDSRAGQTGKCTCGATMSIPAPAPGTQAQPTAAAPSRPAASAPPTTAPYGAPPAEPPSPYGPPAQSPYASPGRAPSAAPRASDSEPEGLNWGAFLLPFLWSIAHNAWLWVVISVVAGPVAAIVLLFTGNHVAWSSRSFANAEQFRAVQKAWTVWGLVLLGVQVVAGILFGAGLVALVLHGGAQGIQGTPQPVTTPGF